MFSSTKYLKNPIEKLLAILLLALTRPPKKVLRVELQVGVHQQRQAVVTMRIMRHIANYL